MPPERPPENGRVCRRLKDLLLQIGLAHYACHQRHAVSTFGFDAMLEAALAGPLRHAARQVYCAPADLPALVREFDDDAHRPRADDAPTAFGHIRNPLRPTINERADRADTERVADPIDVAPQRR